MPLNNESFNEYIYKKAKEGGFDNTIKSERIWTKTNFYIDEQVINSLTAIDAHVRQLLN